MVEFITTVTLLVIFCQVFPAFSNSNIFMVLIVLIEGNKA